MRIAVSRESLFDKYAVAFDQQPLGVGASGAVRLAQNIHTLEWCAVKFLHDSRSAREELRCHLEAQEHHKDGVVRLVDVFENSFRMHGDLVARSWLILVMDLMPGGELFYEIQRREYITEADTIVVVRQVAETLRALHMRGIMHRDIKPENILLEAEGSLARVRLVDFGMATTAKPTTALYTAYYAAPEVVLSAIRAKTIGEPLSYSNKCDMWSLGVVIYVMLCGQQPFRSSSQRRFPHSLAPDLQRAILNGDYDRTSSHYKALSPEAKHVIASLLQTAPEKRWSAEDLLRSRWLAGNQSSSSEVGTGLGITTTMSSSPSQVSSSCVSSPIISRAPSVPGATSTTSEAIILNEMQPGSPSAKVSLQELCNEVRNIGMEEAMSPTIRQGLNSNQQGITADDSGILCDVEM